MAHADHVRKHHPVGGIDEVFHEPPVGFGGVDFAHEHGRSDDHEPFDVVGISVLLGALDDKVDGRESGGAVPPTRFELAVVVESIGKLGGGDVVLPVFGVHPVNELSPTDDLADEAFE